MVRLTALASLLALSLVAGSAIGQTDRLISDTFNGANGARPQGWTVQNDPGPSFWTLTDNRVISGDHSTTGRSEPLLLLTALPGADAWTNYFGQADFRFLGASGGVVQVLRYRDPQNFYEVGIFTEGVNRFAKIDKVQLGVRKTLDRVENSQATPVPSLDSGTDWDTGRIIIRGIVDGNEIGLHVGLAQNLFQMAAYDPDPLPAGRWGFGVVGGSAIFDNAILRTATEAVFKKGSSGGPVTAQVAAAPPAPAQASAPVAGGGNFLVQMATNVPRERADALVSDLIRNGFADAKSIPTGGTFTVVVGAGLSRDRANQLFEQLRGMGYNPESVITADSLGAAGVASTATPAPAQAQVSTQAAEETDFRVQVFDDFTEESHANVVRDNLIRDDYTNVDVVQEGGVYRVFIGGQGTRAEAEALVASLLREGYPRAQVRAVARTSTVSEAPTTDLSEIENLPEMANLPADQRARLSALISRIRAAEAGNISANELLEIRNERKALQEDLRLKLDDISRREQEKRDKEGRIRDLYREIDRAIESGNVAEAEKVLQQARIVYPEFPGHVFKEERIRALRSGGSAASQGAVSAAVSSADVARVNSLLEEGRQAKVERRNAEALAKFQEVLRIDPTNREAVEEVRTLPALVGADRAGQNLQPAWQTYLYYGGSSLVIVGFAVVAVVLYQNVRRERELIKQVTQMQEFVANQSSGRFPVIGSSPAYPVVTGSTPGLTPEQFSALQQGGGLAGAGMGGSGFGQAGFSGGSVPIQSSLSPALGSSPVGTPALPNLAGTESSTTVPLPFPGPPPVRGPLTDDVRLSPIAGPAPRPEVEFPAPPAFPVPAVAAQNAPVLDIPMPPPPADAFAIPGVPVAPAAKMPSSSGFGELPPLPTVPSPAPDSQAGNAVGFNDMQTVFMGPGQAESSGNLFPPVPQISAGPAPLPAQPTPSGFDSAIQGITPAPPLAANQDSSSLVVQNDPSRGVIFMQSFDEETPEEQPLGWVGDYDYASLTVDRAIAAGAGGHCLKFEKRTGAGSANYVCKFPKAGGLVRVEFDIRCDDKNKYLLGFYIEKDEDFKQSIHTIVHRMDSKSTPSLRVQGEPVPYEFGTWRHMCYELNLPAGMVTAYVDGEQVIKDARLPTAPSYINTLSIRDNLATTGLLYLDNIVVSKM